MQKRTRGGEAPHTFDFEAPSFFGSSLVVLETSDEASGSMGSSEESFNTTSNFAAP